jgi:hypothetical protein
MMDGRVNGNGHSKAVYGRLLSAGGELIAEGPCHVDEKHNQATMEPQRTPGVLQKERGRLALQLESGRTLPVSDKAIIFRVKVNGQGPASRRLYRLKLLREVAQENGDGGWPANGELAQDADAAGGDAADDGSTAFSGGETPAAR